jgi:transcriptional regulator with XRE-family HTH domain
VSTPSSLGGRVADLRARKGMLQKDLADQAGISVGFLSEVENGHRTPGAEVLLRIADVLGASLDYLLRGQDPKAEAKPVLIPPSLQEAAEERHWSYEVTASLLRAQGEVRFRRTPTGRGTERPRDWSKQDWIRLHDVLYEDEP